MHDSVGYPTEEALLIGRKMLSISPCLKTISLKVHASIIAAPQVGNLGMRVILKSSLVNWIYARNHQFLLSTNSTIQTQMCRTESQVEGVLSWENMVKRRKLCCNESSHSNHETTLIPNNFRELVVYVISWARLRSSRLQRLKTAQLKITDFGQHMMSPPIIISVLPTSESLLYNRIKLESV